MLNQRIVTVAGKNLSTHEGDRLPSHACAFKQDVLLFTQLAISMLAVRSISTDSSNCCSGMTTIDLKVKTERMRQFMLILTIGTPCINAENESLAAKSVYVHIFVFGISPILKFTEWGCERYYRMAMMDCTSNHHIIMIFEE